MRLGLMLSGILIGLSWFFPLSLMGGALAFVGFFSLLYTVQQVRERSTQGYYRSILLAGMLAHLFGFYWIFTTIREFGHFPIAGAAAVFLLFLTVSSLQFPLFLFVRSFLPAQLDFFALRSPLAWISVELLAIRIFPWSPAHPLSALPPLIQSAELGGITLVSFLFLWFCEALATSARRKSFFLAGSALSGLAAAYLLGSLRITKIDSLATEHVPVALVQGAIPLHDKHDQNLSAQNTLEYLKLSEQFDKPGQLIVWPETVVMNWIPENVGNTAYSRHLPVLHGGSSLIFGALSFRSRNELFNSAFAAGPDGEVPLPYHKRILMPFGEFTPFGDTFPFLRTLNNTAGDFSEGNGVPLIEVPIRGGQDSSAVKKLRVTPLICYEDVLPQIATEGTAQGAQLLVNLTNDAWFGESIAPFQHHQIALFRAIENRRSLIRATNTGLSAIVAATGKTELQLDPFRRAAAEGIVSIHETQTLYTSAPIQQLWKLLAVLCSCLSIFRFLTISRRGATVSRPPVFR